MNGVPTERQLFLDEVAPSVLRHLLVMALHANWQAAQKARVYNEKVRHDILPSLRRAEFQQRLGAMLTPAPLKVRHVKRGPYWNNELVGERVILSALTRTERVHAVSSAEYRSTLAEGSQLALFPHAPEGACLYALLIHGGSPKQALLTQARIVFPLPSGCFVEDELDLLSMFPEVVDAFRAEQTLPALPDAPKEEPVEIPEPQVGLRKERQKRDDE